MTYKHEHKQISVMKIVCKNYKKLNLQHIKTTKII